MNWAGDLCQKEIAEEDVVLDIGCGIMQATLDTIPTYPKTRLQCEWIIGLDRYLPYLQAIKRKEKVSTLRVDIDNVLPLAPKSVDVVLLLDVLEHLKDLRAVKRVLSEASRVARRKVIVLTPSRWKKNQDETTDAYGLGENILQLHRCLLTKRFLQKQGFKVRHPLRLESWRFWKLGDDPMFAVKRVTLHCPC